MKMLFAKSLVEVTSLVHVNMDLLETVSRVNAVRTQVLLHHD